MPLPIAALLLGLYIGAKIVLEIMD